MPDSFREVVNRYEALMPYVEEFVKALDSIEYGGTLVDEVVIPSKKRGDAFIVYTSRPLALTIERGDKKYIFKVVSA